MTDTGSRRPARRPSPKPSLGVAQAGPRAAADTRRRPFDRARILSRDALAYGRDAGDIEIEALSDDVIAGVRLRHARDDE